MNDIYKILLAATIGFMLSPITELLKARISLIQQKSKLIAKLEAFDTILCRAIPTITTTIINREQFIENPEKYLSTIFITPNFNLPKIESNIDGAYHALSSSQRITLLNIESQATHIEKLLEKLRGIDEECKSTIYQKANIKREITKEAEVREIEKEHYIRAISCEKAILYTSACMLATVRRAIKSDPTQPKDIDTIKQISDELEIKINLDWWQQFRS